MLNDANLRLRGIFATHAHLPALRPVFGVVQTGVITGHAQHGGGHANTNAGLIHHVKHVPQTLVRLANKIANSAGFAIDRIFAFTKVQQRIGRAAPAQLVVQARQRHVVAHAREFTLFIDQFFGHDEE